MPKVRVSAFSISLDGYGAGPDQSLETPLGKGGEELHGWMTSTRTFHAQVGKDGGLDGVDDDYTRRSMEGMGAWILGRNMFGPVRGDWPAPDNPDGEWKGWWGDNPPYHVPTFVLTNHAREPVEMDGGTTFIFATGGIEETLERAKAAAGDRDVRIGGGAATIRQYLEKGLIDEMHIAISPIILGGGESLFAGLDLPALGYRVAEHVTTDAAMHVAIVKG